MVLTFVQVPYLSEQDSCSVIGFHSLNEDKSARDEDTC